MATQLITTHELEGTRVLGGKNGTKRIGKVRRFVFAPRAKRCIGFLVKRPDVLWMFRRKDMFVSIKGFDWVDGRIVVRNEPDAVDRGSIKAMGLNWDECVLWLGLPVVTESGESLGIVGDVMFNQRTGLVESLTTDSGATANAILGKRTIPADEILGFRKGVGVALAEVGSEGVQQEEGSVELGAIVVTDAAATLNAEGGVAEAAGKATAVAVDKVHKTVDKAVDKAKPVVSDAAKAAGEAINAGARATGEQIAKSKTMFSDFKEEYDKASGKKAAAKKPAAGAKKSAGTSASSAAKKGASGGAKKSSSAAKPAGTAAKKAATTKKPAGAAKAAGTAKKAAPKKQPPKKNMFEAFKEEYDKARHDD
uniref:PRC-barrel domain protein n=1 Tax=Muribaculaceae bacterium Z82 TaxID=2304548 RepID=A0A7C9JC84_9BACT